MKSLNQNTNLIDQYGKRLQNINLEILRSKRLFKNLSIKKKKDRSVIEVELSRLQPLVLNENNWNTKDLYYSLIQVYDNYGTERLYRHCRLWNNLFNEIINVIEFNFQTTSLNPSITNDLLEYSISYLGIKKKIENEQLLKLDEIALFFAYKVRVLNSAILKYEEKINLLNNKEIIKTKRIQIKASEYHNLSELFTDPKHYKMSFQALLKASIIDKNNKYTLGLRDKAAFASWWEIIKEKGFVYSIARQKLGNLLNKEITNLQLGKDAKTLINTHNTAAIKFKKILLPLI